MSISIALCTYNGARFLQAQLDSYVAQLLPPYEVVVCDDGSSDGTLPILEKFARSAPFPVRIFVNVSNLGVAANFGRAIELCQGDIIALSDQDDVWFPAKLQRVSDALALDECAGLVFSDADAIDTEGNSLRYRLWDAVRFTRSERANSRCGRLLEALLRHYIVTGATLAFRSRYRDLLLPIPADCLHDAWIALLICSVAGGTIIDEPLVGYRQHHAQVSGGERILGLLAQAGWARSESMASIEQTARRYDMVRARLRSSAYAWSARSPIDQLGQKVAHWHARAAMRDLGAGRLPIIARELLASRYRRYSHAWKYVAADLFF